METLSTSTSVDIHGQPCLPGTASKETGNCDISGEYCDIVNTLCDMDDFDVHFNIIEGALFSGATFIITTCWRLPAFPDSFDAVPDRQGCP